MRYLDGMRLIVSRGKARPVAEGGVGFERPDGQGHAFAGRGLRGVGYGIVTGDAEIFFEVLTLFVGQGRNLAETFGAPRVVRSSRRVRREEEANLSSEIEHPIDDVDRADGKSGLVSVSIEGVVISGLAVTIVITGTDANGEITDLPVISHRSGSHDFWIGLDGPDAAAFELSDEIGSGHGVERSNVYDLDSARLARSTADVATIFQSAEQAVNAADALASDAGHHLADGRGYSARAIEIAAKVSEQAALLCGEADHAAAPVWRDLRGSASERTASRADSVFMEAPMGFGFRTLHFHRENVVG